MKKNVNFFLKKKKTEHLLLPIISELVGHTDSCFL